MSILDLLKILSSNKKINSYCIWTLAFVDFRILNKMGPYWINKNQNLFVLVIFYA